MKKRLLSYILTVLVVTTLIPAISVTASATEIVDNGYCGAGDHPFGENLTWTLYSDGLLTISGIGQMYQWSNADSPWLKYSDDIKHVIMEEGVTDIKDGAFAGCTNMTTVSIPNTVSRIRKSAFSGCSALHSVTIPDSVTIVSKEAFSGCESLSEINLPHSIARIEEYTFSHCSNLKSISIPDSVEYIGNGAFSHCSSMNQVYIPNSVTYVGSSVFSHCSGLKNVHISENISTIERGAFEYCTGLTDIILGKNITYVGSDAFERCEEVNSLTILNSNTNFSLYAFYGTGFKSIYYCGSKAQWEKILEEDRSYAVTRFNYEHIYYNSAGSKNILLNAMNATPATEYNNDLAEIAAQLSLKTYDDGCGDPTSIENYLHYDLGFDSDKIWSKNYGSSFAFTIAKMDCPTDDADEILVIAAQGTTLQLKEMFGDAFYGTSSENRKFFGGYYPYQVAVAFYSEIVSFDYKNSISLYNLTEQNKRYKILLTGHSLGGAAANLVAANLTAGRHIGAALDYVPDVYCYTFGAIDSIDVDSPVTDGYKNIHNVYNELDTLSPTQYGNNILKNGTGSRNGKFGVIEAFEYDYRSDGDKELPDQIQALQHINHDMDKYLEAVQSGKVENSIFRPNSKAAQEWAVNYMVEQLNGYLVAGCPVDVDVYCDGELVGRVVNNTVDESVTSIPIIVEGDIKFIFYSDGQKLDLIINAYDEGTMTFYAQDLAGAGNVKMMTNVALTDGKTMTSEVSGDIDTSETQLLVVDENNKIVSKVLSDGTETEVNKDEIVFGNTDLINTGEKILISSVIENFTAEESEPMNIIAALYYDGIMIDFGIYRDVIIPVNREIRKNFELKCQGKYQDDVSKLKVKLFYWNNISQLTPIRGVTDLFFESTSSDDIE